MLSSVLVVPTLRSHSYHTLTLAMPCSVLPLPAFLHQSAFSHTRGDNFSMDGCGLGVATLIEEDSLQVF